jgi:TetR/AcrR family transcriptional regulator, transcriptional repressor of bet genes
MPKIVNPTDQRMMIAEAAINVISSNGIDSTRLKDVARRAEVTTGAVMHYFEDKNAVIEAALAEIVRRTLLRITAGGPVSGSAPVKVSTFIDRVCTYLPITEASQAEWRVWLAFWGRAIADQRLRDIHQRHYSNIVSALLPQLQQLRPTAVKSSSAQLTTIADALVAAIDGVGTRATLEPALWPAKKQRQTLATLMAPMLDVFASPTSGQGELP